MFHCTGFSIGLVPESDSKVLKLNQLFRKVILFMIVYLLLTIDQQISPDLLDCQQRSFQAFLMYNTTHMVLIMHLNAEYRLGIVPEASQGYHMHRLRSV